MAQLKVVLRSASALVLTAACEALAQVLLFPLAWQHAYRPLENKQTNKQQTNNISIHIRVSVHIDTYTHVYIYIYIYIYIYVYNYTSLPLSISLSLYIYIYMYVYIYIYIYIYIYTQISYRPLLAQAGLLSRPGPWLCGLQRHVLLLSLSLLLSLLSLLLLLLLLL